jgi:hypothetical protein
MSLNAADTSRCSAAPVTSARAPEVAGLEPARRRGQVAQRPRERAGQEPGEREPEDQRERADRDQRQHTAANARVDGGKALRHAGDAHDLAVVRDRDRRVEQVLAEGVAVTLALGAVPVERRCDLGARGVRDIRSRRDSRVREQPAAHVDHDHAGAEGPAGAAGERAELRPVVHLARCVRGHDERLRGGLVLHLRVDAPRQVQRERHLERDDDQQQHIRERAEQLVAEAHWPTFGR